GRRGGPDREAARRRGDRRALLAGGEPAGAAGGRTDRRRERGALHAQAAARARRRRRRLRPRRRGDHACRLARAGLRHRPAVRDALAARRAAGRRGRQSGARRDDRARHLLYRLPAARRPGASGRADRARPPRARPPGAARGAPGLGAARDRRLLEALHARRLRDQPLPDAEVPADAAAPGARLPVPLLDVRPRDRRDGAVRAGGAAASAAAALGRRRRGPARGRNLLGPGRPGLVGGASAVIRKLVRFVDSRSGTAPLIRKALRYVFPDHWSFLLGEIAMYAFVVLVATGTYLALFFHPSEHPVVYQGSSAPLKGQVISEAYQSVVHISFHVKAGLLIRQTHHWAANVFLA